MAVVSTGLIPDGATMGLTLDRYQEVERICISSFNGLLRTDTEECCSCDAVWTQADRDALAVSIMTAENMRENELNYHVAPKYLTEEHQGYDFPLILNKKLLIALGCKANTTISASEALTLRTGGAINDPVVIVVATTVTDPKEIVVTYPGQPDWVIRPTSVVISGGNATISIPRARLMTEEAMFECTPTPRYDDDANFITTVDVLRTYTDPSCGAYMVWTNMQKYCGSGQVYPGETTQTMYGYIEAARIAAVKMYPADYASGVWTGVNPSICYRPDFLRVNYLSGKLSSLQNDVCTARLAHTVLPTFNPGRMAMCSCWTPDLVDAKLWTPYGNMVGAVYCWMTDSRSKVGQGGKFPRI